MYRTTAITLAAVLGLGVAGAALAGDRTGETQHRSEGAAGQSTAEDASRAQGMSTSSEQQAQSDAETLATAARDLIGKTVQNSAGEEIGDIQDVAVGPDQNTYAIVSVDEFLGMGGKDVPINLSELQLRGENVILMSESSPEALKQRPEYDPSEYRSLNEEEGTPTESE